MTIKLEISVFQKIIRYIRYIFTPDIFHNINEEEDKAMKAILTEATRRSLHIMYSALRNHYKKELYLKKKKQFEYLIYYAREAGIDYYDFDNPYWANCIPQIGKDNEYPETCFDINTFSQLVRKLVLTQFLYISGGKAIGGKNKMDLAFKSQELPAHLQRDYLPYEHDKNKTVCDILFTTPDQQVLVSKINNKWEAPVSLWNHENARKYTNEFPNQDYQSRQWRQALDQISDQIKKPVPSHKPLFESVYK